MHDFLLKDGVVVNRTSLDGTFIYAFFLATTAFLAGLATLTFPKEPAKLSEDATNAYKKWIEKSKYQPEINIENKTI